MNPLLPALLVAQVECVIGLRNLGRLLPSSWQQYLKYGLDMGYERWLTGVFDNNGKATPSFWRRNDHADVIGRWAAAVGPENVTVMVLDGLDLKHLKPHRSLEYRSVL